jgi:hypothetical protein
MDGFEQRFLPVSALQAGDRVTPEPRRDESEAVLVEMHTIQQGLCGAVMDVQGRTGLAGTPGDVIPSP